MSLDWVPVSGVELLFGNRDTADSKERGSPFERQGIILCARVLMKPRIFLGWSLHLRVSAKGLGPSLYSCPGQSFRELAELEFPLGQRANWKEVFGNRVPSTTRSAVASVVPALSCPAWGLRAHWTRICGPRPQQPRDRLQPTNRFVYDWFASGARWFPAN